MNTKNLVHNFFQTNRKLVSTIVILAVVAIALKVSTPIIVWHLVKTVTANIDAPGTTTVIVLTIVMILTNILYWVVESMRNSQIIHLGNDLTCNLRSIAFNSIMKADISQIETLDKDEVSETIIEECHTIGNTYFANHIIKVIYFATVTVTLSITMLVLHFLYGSVILLSLPVMYGIVKLISSASKKSDKKYYEGQKHHNKYLIENYDRMKVLKIKNGIEKETNIYENIIKENQKNYTKMQFLKETNANLIIEIFTGVAWVLMFAIYSISINNNGDSSNLVSGISAGLILVPQIFSSFKVTIDEYNNKVNVEEAYKKMDVVYAIKNEARSESIQELEEVRTLKFEEVSFDYANGKIGVDGINFELKRGERLGILGLSDSGKTTIADLLVKLIKPKRGGILINNCDISKVNTYYIRDIIAYVPQDSKLLDGSIENNIIYPMNMDEYKYNDSLNKCNLKDLLYSLPDRDESIAKELELTESDIQKIAIANALYKDPPIMVFDDATKKLDAKSENDILEEISKLKNKIIILISNHINNLMRCDKILILNNGKVVEYGKLDELLSDKKSTFSQMLSIKEKKAM